MKHAYEDTQKLLDKKNDIGSTSSSGGGWSLSKPVLGLGMFLLVVSIITLLGSLFHGSTLSVSRNFVTVEGTVFMDGDAQFLVGGVNVYNVIERYMADPDHVRRALDTLSKDGVTVIRIFAHTTNAEYPFQLLENPRGYNEEGLKALDEILYICEEKNIRVLMSLADTWMYYGGVQWYVDHSDTAEKRESAVNIPQGDFDFSKLSEEQTEYLKKRQTLFFSDPGARDLYKHHIKTLLERKNTKKNGLAYKDDPTIFGFGLLNEMRCELSYNAACRDTVPEFLEDVTRYIRSIDTNHLVTVGEEGFYTSDSDEKRYNPGTWAEGQGQDFLRDHSIPGISYASIHVWSKNWEAEDEIGFLKEWIESHSNITSGILGIPLLIEEIGRKIEDGSQNEIRSKRDPVVQAAFNHVTDSLSQYGVLSGALLWEFSIGEERASSYTVREDSSTYSLLKKHVRNLQRNL